MRVVVLRNTGSSRNRGRPAPPAPAGIERFELNGIASLPELLGDLANKGTDILVVDGGDGTVREVVSCLPEAFPEGTPMIGILANGNTNLVARKHGRVRDYDALARLCDTNQVLDFKTVPVLRIDGLFETPVRGFIAGWGAYAAGTRIAVEEVSSRGGRQIVFAILSVLRRVLWGHDAASLRGGVPVDVTPEGHAGLSGPGFAGIFTVLEGALILGLKPFWGTGDGAIRWLDIAAPPHRLWIAAPFLALGQPRRWMQSAGYRSGRSSEVRLQVDGGLVVDGELYPTQRTQPLLLSAREVIRVVSL